MLLLVLAILAAALSDGNPVSFERAVLAVRGQREIEDLDENEVERFRQFYDNPLKINLASRSRLISSGLMSVYQVESFLDYKSRCGNVLSFSELALVDGFGEDLVSYLKLFVSLESGTKALERRYGDSRQSFVSKAGVRLTGGGSTESSFGFVYAGEYASCIEAAWAARATYTEKKFLPGTISLAYYGKGHLGKIVVGNFNARFGQGLTLWSGTTMNGFTASSSFVRSGTGVSATKSLSSTLRGVAADFSFGRLGISAAYSDSRVGMAAVSWIGGTWSIGSTFVCDWTNHRKAPSLCLGADWRVGFPGGAAYGELVWKGSLAAVAGAFWIPSYGRKISLLLRWYPSSFSNSLAGAARSSGKCSDECGASLGLQGKFSMMTVDCVRHPSKASSVSKLILATSPEFNCGKLRIEPSFRAAVKYDSASSLRRAKWDQRVQLDLTLGGWMLSSRANLLFFRDWSFLAYLDGGYAAQTGFKCWARAGLFVIDNWDDRIYVYERDAPGNFTVPAFYGRGWWSSLFTGYVTKKDRQRKTSHSVWLRCSLTSYPFMASPKPTKLESKLEYRLLF